jgi:hypothetical protein
MIRSVLRYFRLHSKAYQVLSTADEHNIIWRAGICILPRTPPGERTEKIKPTVATADKLNTGYRVQPKVCSRHENIRLLAAIQDKTGKQTHVLAKEANQQEKRLMPPASGHASC